MHLDRITERLAEIGAAPLSARLGNPIDNAVAESTIGLYRTEPEWSRGRDGGPGASSCHQSRRAA